MTAADRGCRWHAVVCSVSHTTTHVTRGQELEVEHPAATPYCTLFGVDVPLKRWFHALAHHPSNPLLRFYNAPDSDATYSPLST